MQTIILKFILFSLQDFEGRFSCKILFSVFFLLVDLAVKYVGVAQGIVGVGGVLTPNLSSELCSQAEYGGY